MADNENKKSNEEVNKKPVEKKNTANQEKNKKVETKEISGSYITGIIGAILILNWAYKLLKHTVKILIDMK